MRGEPAPSTDATRRGERHPSETQPEGESTVAGVAEVTDQNFEKEIVQSPKPAVVDFWAEWCGPCRVLSPTIDQIAEEFTGKVKVGKVDTDANREVSVQYGISAITTVILFKNGEVQKKYVGLQSKGDLVTALESLLD